MHSTFKKDKPEELNDCGILSNDFAEAMNARGPIPQEIFLFSYSENQQIS
jgi:hypothetical protein